MACMHSHALARACMPTPDARARSPTHHPALPAPPERPHNKHTHPPTHPHTPPRAVPTGLNAATIIGDYVTVEPYCVLRSCRIEPKVLIGARSVVCEGAIVETESILAPGSVVPPARRIPSGELWGGNPARFIRKLTGNEVGGGWRPGPPLLLAWGGSRSARNYARAQTW